MFALLLHESMDPFYRNISSFPTALFTVLLGVCVLYWLCAVLGVVDLDILDVNVPDADLGDHAGDPSNVNALAGLLLKLGLNGVPLTIIISIVALLGWTLCYFVVHFLFQLVPDGWFRYVLGLPVFIATLYTATLMTAALIRPLRPLFKNATQHTVKLVLGQTAIVRTSRVDENFGEANLADGGAGLILKVRAETGQTFTKGERVVLLEYFKDTNTYRVISESEFSG
ncbi:MAG: hypothetical protein ACI8W7_003780 [Gammaproteobacteria bacterium]|jgi:hypothetical protein